MFKNYNQLFGIVFFVIGQQLYAQVPVKVHKEVDASVKVYVMRG